MNTSSFKQDPVEALLKDGRKNLWYPIGPSEFVGERPVSLRRLGKCSPCSSVEGSNDGAFRGCIVRCGVEGKSP